MPFSTRSLNRFFFGRLIRSFPSSNSLTSTNATRDSRYSVNANLNLNPFRQAMLDGVLPPPQPLHPTMLHVGSNLVR